MKRIAPARIVSLCLLAACAALGQSVQRQPNELPDAPSQVVLIQADRLQNSGNEARLPLTGSTFGINADVVRATHITPEAQLTVTALSKGSAGQEKTNDFFSKYLNASPRHAASYQPSSSGKVMERATDAASRIFFTHDLSGKTRLNAQYFLRVLTSVAADSASRRYRARSSTAPLSDFGSTVGNDAGMNLLHEFGPGIRQKMAGRLPEFVSRIGQRISRPASSR